MTLATTKPSLSDALDHLQEQGFLSQAQRLRINENSESSLKSLIDHGWVPERAFALAMNAVYRIPIVDHQKFPSVMVEGTQGLASFLQEHEALPLSKENGVLKLALADPSDDFLIKVLGSKLNCDIDLAICIRSELLQGIAAVYGSLAPQKNAIDQPSSAALLDLPDDLNSDSVLVRRLHGLIQRAVSSRASDIHFEPLDSRLRVRFRVHGILREIDYFEDALRDQVIARLKLMSKLDVTEKRFAQNGRFKFPADGRVIDLRVSTLPLHEGESVVLRLLEFELSQLPLNDLGFRPSIAQSLEQLIRTQQGLILITGPTGSGKSTTLYSLLNRLNDSQRKLISIEDPVELNIAGVNQIQVDEEYGLSFATALKTVLRQDPDVIMVGEIRDTETAQLAAQAALTGHLVLATLHTASAASAITRLQNLGLPDYLISATVTGVLAQRLLRCRCMDCEAAVENAQCQNCSGTGCFGRTAISELLPSSAFEQCATMSEEALSTTLLDKVCLRDDAQRLIDNKLVDTAEVLRVLGV